jgi:hypothetical protein
MAPDRKALAEAITAHAAAETAKTALADGLDAAKRAEWTATKRLSAAITAIEQAQDADAQAIAEGALAGQPLASVPRTEAAAMAAKAQAEAALEAAKRDLSTLEAAQAEAERRAFHVGLRHDAALEAALLPVLETLAARVTALLTETLQLGEGLFAVRRQIRGAVSADAEHALNAVLLARAGHSIPPGWQDPWGVALERLRTDANAPLPPVASGSAQ